MEPTENTGSEQTEPQEEEKKESLGTQCTLEEAGPWKRRIKAEVPADKVTEELDKNYKELISTVQIPGFRRGHVPRPLLEKRYGKEIDGDVKESLVGMSFQEVVEANSLKVIGKPKFDNIVFAKGEPLRYEVELEIQPEFELGPYKGLEVEDVGEDQAPPLTPEAVDSQIERLRQRTPELVVIDPAEAGPKDMFIGRYVLVRDGLRVHSVEDVRFQPESSKIAGFEIPDLAQKVASRGASPAFSATAKVPGDYSEEVLRGKEVEIQFTIDETRRIQYPPVDDAFAQRYGCSSLAELRDRVSKEFEAGRKATIEAILEERILEKVASGIQFNLPEGVLEDQVKMRRLRREYALIDEGRSPEEIEAELKKADETVTDEIRRELKKYFILDKIAEVEKIFATEDEVNLRVAILARAYGRPVKRVHEEMDQSGRIETLRAEIRHTKVRKFLREKAKVVPAGQGAAPVAEAQAAGAPAGAESAATPAGTEPAATPTGAESAATPAGTESAGAEGGSGG